MAFLWCSWWRNCSPTPAAPGCQWPPLLLGRSCVMHLPPVASSASASPCCSIQSPLDSSQTEGQRCTRCAALSLAQTPLLIVTDYSRANWNSVLHGLAQACNILRCNLQHDATLDCIDFEVQASTAAAAAAVHATVAIWKQWQGWLPSCPASHATQHANFWSFFVFLTTSQMSLQAAHSPLFCRRPWQPGSIW